jgi:HEAT repeat protein
MAEVRGAWKARVSPGVGREGRMALFRTSKPNVNALARRRDEGALVAAAGYQDLIPAGDDELVDRGSPIRKEAILALGRLGPQCGMDAVHAALSDPADEVRIAAIRVLFARQDIVPLAAALAWLPPAEQGRSRALAILALRELRKPECAPALAAALVRGPRDDSIADDEASLLKLLLEAGAESEVAEEVVETLLVALGDEQDLVSDRAEELLVLMAPHGTEALIAELIAGAVPHRAAVALAQIKDTRALKPLIDGLVHRDSRVRAECAAALGELRDPAAVEALIHASQDPEHRVRAQAGWALDRLGMIALVVGVSTMIRPVIQEALSATELRPALTEPEDAASRNGRAGDDEDVPAGPIDPEEVRRLLARTEDAA